MTKFLISVIKRYSFLKFLAGHCLGFYQDVKILASEFLVSGERVNHDACDVFKTKVLSRSPEGFKHIVYASFPSIWEEKNIPTSLETKYKVTRFYISDYDVPIQNRDLVKAFVDSHFSNFIEKTNQMGKVDLVITYFSGAEISASTISSISDMGIPIISFHWDDRLHFKGYRTLSGYSGPNDVSPYYDLNLTSSYKSLKKYAQIGADALFWPEGSNIDTFKPQGNSKFKYDVSFVGARYGFRDKLISFLRRNGIAVECFGKGWERDSVTHEEMMEIYSTSKINLGFGFIGYSHQQCLKGRDFEVPSCGAVYLTSHNDDLERVYDLETEIMTYRSGKDCLTKINKLLGDDEGCRRLRLRSRLAVIDRHQWVTKVDNLLNVE
jgi:spore maturation protein CgeB